MGSTPSSVPLSFSGGTRRLPGLWWYRPPPPEALHTWPTYRASVTLTHRADNLLSTSGACPAPILGAQPTPGSARTCAEHHTAVCCQHPRGPGHHGDPATTHSCPFSSLCLPGNQGRCSRAPVPLQQPHPTLCGSRSLWRGRVTGAAQGSPSAHPATAPTRAGPSKA